MSLPRESVVGCLLGLAVGDALGTTLEFRGRDECPALTDMVGGGVFGLAPGERQIAGALWGRSRIPDAWLHRLAWRREIEDRARALLARAG